MQLNQEINNQIKKEKSQHLFEKNWIELNENTYQNSITLDLIDEYFDLPGYEE